MWAYLYKKCIKCGLTDFKHTSKGLCLKCWRKDIWQKKKAKLLVDPKFRAEYNKAQHKWIRNHKEYYRKLKRRLYNTPHQKKIRKARSKVYIAIQQGKLKRLPCEICGSTKQNEGHHPDYRSPLKVRWLCRVHHIAEHKKKSTH